MAPELGSRTAAQKLGVRPGDELVLIGAAGTWELGDLPPEVVLLRPNRVPRTSMSSQRRVVLAFSRSRRELERCVAPLAQTIFPNGLLWFAWPRRAGGHSSDITDNVVRSAALENGIVDVKVAALDHDWSALCFVWRKELRKG